MIHELDTPSFLIFLVPSENLIISICYFIIASGIAYSISRNISTGIDFIVVAIAGIFFSCGLGHGFHAAEMFGLPNLMLFQAIADMLTVIIAICFLSMYKSFNLLTRFSKIVASEAQLQIQNKTLADTLSELKLTQIQLIQYEKMSSLGQLVAGVAHEINNPLGFLSGNIKIALEYIQDLFDLLDLYENELPQTNQDIQDKKESIDLEYLREDLPKLISSMCEGIKRIQNISTSLRIFSRADQNYKVPFKISEGIDSTILILKHRLKANEQRQVIEVITEYGNLPEVECYPGQLNQVFMNILANAIDALEESNMGRSLAEIKAKTNRITITTSIADQWVKISIADNGQGMTESVKQKIFDHLFTTKAVGQGTGLGLAIAKQIVEETHSGKLQCHSVLGEGTEFIIEIPVS